MTTPAAAAAHEAVRAEQMRTLIEIASIPTASGREGRVIAAVGRWVAARPDVRMEADAAGNLVLSLPASSGRSPGGPGVEPPLFFTAHLDHPGFVVERIVGPGTVELSFRGGVMDVFFEDAPVMLYRADDRVVHATLTGRSGQASPAGEHYLAELHAEDDPSSAGLGEPAGGLRVGDIGTWLMPAAELDGQGLVHAPGCDDLSAVAAALSALDGYRAALAGGAGAKADVRVLFTRAEEIGFIGAIAACRHGTMPRGSRVVALENSRSTADSPIGGGPIVRVGDRMSTFTPWLTGACAARAEEAFGGAAQPLSTQRAGAGGKRRPWQRKLMSGGACEASVFCHAGYDATCLCLPLGNYHNMPHLDALQAGAYDRSVSGPARAAREFIHSWDYYGLVDLLVALALKPPSPELAAGGEGSAGARFEKLLRDKGYVLAEGP